MRSTGKLWVAAGCLTLGIACGRGPEPTPGEPAVQALAIDTPQGGTTAWVRQLGGAGNEYVVEAAPAPDGGAVLLTFIGERNLAPSPPSALGIVRLDSTGAIRWSREIPVTIAKVGALSIATSGMGNVFVALTTNCTLGTDCPNFGGGEVTGQILVKLDPSGRFVWQRDLGPVSILSNVAVDPNGGPVIAVRNDAQGPFSSRLVKYRWDGVRIWDLPAPSVNGDIPSKPSALAFDPSGNLAVGDRLAITSLDPAGVVRWTAHLADPSVLGGFVGIGTTSLGTVVAVVIHAEGTLSWAGTQSTLPANSPVNAAVLVVAETNGAPRFARVLADPASSRVESMSVDPAGRVAVLLTGACPTIVDKWNLDGARLWTRSFCSGSAGFWGQAIAVDPITHHVIAVGGITPGTLDLGTGPVTSRGNLDGVVVDLRP